MTGIHRIRLSADDAGAARALVGGLASRFDSVEDQDFQQRAAVYAHDLPLALREALVEFRLGEPAGLCVISGWPVDDGAIGPTPEHWLAARSPSPTLPDDLFFFLCASLLGDPFAWATAQRGRLLQDILPVRGNEDRQLGTSSTTALTWHIEDSFHPYRADYLGLLCLRNPDAVPTTYASIADVDLPPEWADQLGRDQFVIRPDESHTRRTLLAVAEDFGAPAWLIERALARQERMRADPERVAVLFGSPDQPYLLINSFYMDQPADPAARAALDGVIEALDSAMRGIALAQGDILFLDNYKVVHGRSPFTARYDGTDRWLRRLNVTRDLRKSRDLRMSPHARVVF
jgi:Fe(II)/alpha-ketoglutarate-dependent arginine beta-hydroxylase